MSQNDVYRMSQKDMYTIDTLMAVCQLPADHCKLFHEANGGHYELI